MLDSSAVTSWLALVPGEFPWRCLHVAVAPGAVERALDGLDLAPLEACPPNDASRPDARVFASADAARAARASANHFGTYVSVALRPTAVEIELFGEPLGFEPELRAVTRLLARLVAPPSRASFTAFSYEMGSGARSELREGEAAALARLVGE